MTEWQHILGGESGERFDRKIGPFKLIVWVTGDWIVQAFGHTLKGSAETSEVDKGKAAAEAYVMQFFAKMKMDWGFL